MRTIRILPLVLVFAAAPALAQEEDERLLAGDVLDKALCEQMRDRVMKRIEAFTRMKFRRAVPVRVEPKGVWDNKRKRQGFNPTEHALAYYTPGLNSVTVVPWVIGGYAGGNPAKKSRSMWIAELEPTMIHELTHAIHHQNFWTEGRDYAASMRKDGLSEEELDRATVSFLMGEGVPELVSLRTTDFPERMHRHPGRDLPSPIHYMRRYRPDGKQPYRAKLLALGYVDGLDLMHHLQLKAGSRGFRAVLYRPPPRVLLFQPALLATVDLDDPPEPDSIFGFLSPEILKGREIRRAVNPGSGRYFGGASKGRRVEGCLLGYTAEVGSEDGPNGLSRYAFYVSDPEVAGATWVSEQLAGLKAMNEKGVTEKEVDLPLEKGVRAKLVVVGAEDGSLYAYAETGGLVVIAHEAKPTKNLAERVVLALRALYIRKPKKDLYTAAKGVAIRKLGG